MTTAVDQERKFDDVAYCMAALESKFGLGTNPRRREDLYRRIAESIKRFRDPAYRIVCECAGEAQSKDAPDRYFCAAVHKRLRDRGYWVGDSLELF